MTPPHWSFFLPFGPETRLLEVGPGTGVRSCGVAANVGSLDALCFSERQAREVEDRARASGTENLRPGLYEPGGRLPFDEATFDGVVVDRLVNYLPHVERLLGECRRVLVSGGVLYLGVDNRWFHGLGLSIPVGRLRKSTVRPDRELEANLAALPPRRADRRTLAAYRGLLVAAGLSGVRSFAPLPDAVSPQVVVTLDGPESQRFLFRDRVRRHSAKTRVAAGLGRLAVGAGLLPHVVPFYYLVATR